MCSILTAVIWSNCLNLTEKWYSHCSLGFIAFHERASGIKAAPCHTPCYTTHTHTHTHTYTHPIWPTYCTGHSLFVMAGSKLWSSESAHDAAARLVSFTKNKQTHNCALPETLTREHHELLHCTHTEHSWCDASPVRTGFTTPPKPRVRRWNTRLSFRHGCTFFLQIQDNNAFFFFFFFSFCVTNENQQILRI